MAGPQSEERRMVVIGRLPREAVSEAHLNPVEAHLGVGIRSLLLTSSSTAANSCL